jgi:myo-inositol 2-dehydrogenase / D-chiro-inositol 1-dehydrogenase
MRIGIVGCGRMGNERARAAAALGHQLLVMYDPDHTRAEMLAAGYSGARAVSVYDDLPWHKLDAVFICTAPGVRTKYELAAIEARLPFFVEKPIAVYASECATVLNAIRRTPTLHGVGYMNRCRHSVRVAREMLMHIDILGACCHWVGRKYQVDWWLQADQSGGPLNEQATHAFDLFRFLVGEISAVAATAPEGAPRDQAPLSVACVVNFVAGQLGTLLYSCEAADKHINILIITTRGMLEFEGWELRLVANTVNGELPPEREEDIFLVETAQFLSAVEKNDPTQVPCDLFDACRTQLAVDAARTSLDTGQKVSTEARFHLQKVV